MSTELLAIADRLARAGSYLDVFGECDGDGKKQDAHIKRIYRKLARAVHPDAYSATDDKELAETAFQNLQNFMEAAKRAVNEGRYGEVLKLVVKTKAYEHSVAGIIASGDIADIYAAESKNGSSIVPSALKLARKPADTDLMEAEARALKKLTGAGSDENFQPFFPELIDSFRMKNGGVRRGNVLTRLDGWYSLAKVKQSYPAGIPPLDAVWMWRKALWAIGYAHQRGLVHGALVPTNILIHPEHHGLKLIDWCYSTELEPGATAPIKAIVPAYRSWYPPEVTARETPSPATDIYMTVKTMTDLMGGDVPTGNMGAGVPKGIRAFLRGSSQANQRLRPQSAWDLLVEFDELLEQLGGQYYPRRFREFKMPA